MSPWNVKIVITPTFLVYFTHANVCILFHGDEKLDNLKVCQLKNIFNKSDIRLDGIHPSIENAPKLFMCSCLIKRISSLEPWHMFDVKALGIGVLVNKDLKLMLFLE